MTIKKYIIDFNNQEDLEKASKPRVGKKWSQQLRKPGKGKGKLGAANEERRPAGKELIGPEKVAQNYLEDIYDHPNSTRDHKRIDFGDIDHEDKIAVIERLTKRGDLKGIAMLLAQE